MKNLETIYIWKINADKKMLYHVSSSISQASILMRQQFNLTRSFVVNQYLDKPIPFNNTYFFTTDLKYPSEEFIEQMKFLKKNN